MSALPQIRIPGGLDTTRAQVVAHGEFSDCSVWLVQDEGQGWVVIRAGEGDVEAFAATRRRTAGWECLIQWPAQQALWLSLVQGAQYGR